jgi:hypothetical protein
MSGLQKNENTYCQQLLIDLTQCQKHSKSPEVCKIKYQEYIKICIEPINEKKLYCSIFATH